jgi:hypothetical protein
MRCAMMLLFLAASAVSAGEPAPLPDLWLGDWKGTLLWSKAKGPDGEIPMELQIRPIKDSRDCTWRIIYGVGDKRQVRDYVLQPVAKKPGYFVIDEKNGVLLDCRLVGQTIYTQFEVAGSLLTTRYERRGDGLHVEITSSTRNPAAEGAKTPVRTFTTQTVQAGELRRAKE